MLVLVLLTTTRRGTSCSAASSAYRYPMAAVRVIDNLFATPLLLLLCSLWRLSTKSNATTATMKRMRAPRAPNESFARGEKREDVLEHSKQLNADPLGSASRPRSSFQLPFACPTPAYQTQPERAQKPNKNCKLDPTDDMEGPIWKVSSRHVPSNK